jgi:hypothetical protein
MSAQTRIIVLDILQYLIILWLGYTWFSSMNLDSPLTVKEATVLMLLAVMWLQVKER